LSPTMQPLMPVPLEDVWLTAIDEELLVAWV
jgi:hypothetical protein